MIGMTKALAREVSTRSILVNAIAPGPINTDMLAEETEEWICAQAGRAADRPLRRASTRSRRRRCSWPRMTRSYYVGQTLCPNGGDVML